MILLPVTLLLSAAAVGIHAAPATNSETPIITATFYDPNYHDDGRSRLLQGPTAASSSSTLNVINPYTSSSVVNHNYNKLPSASASSSSSSSDGGTIMAIVDHYYGPNGEEEKVQYKTANEMDKDELDSIMASIGNAKLANHPPPHMSPPQTSTSGKLPSYVHPPPHPTSPKFSSSPATSATKYEGQIASNLYKSSSNPTSYTSSAQGYSLPSIYKSSGEVYSKPPAQNPSPYRPAAFSTIYKDSTTYSNKDSPYSFSASPAKTHYSKGPSDYLPPKEPYYASSYKEPAPLSNMRGPPYFTTTSTSDSPAHPPPPKSISDSLLAEGYKPYPPKSVNTIEHENIYSYPPSSSYSPAPPPPPPHFTYSKPTTSYSSGPPPPPPGYTRIPPSHAHHESMVHHHHAPPPPPPRHNHPHMTSHEMTAIRHGHSSSSDEFPSHGKLYSDSVYLLNEEYPNTFKMQKPGHVSSVPITYSSPDLQFRPPSHTVVRPNGYSSDGYSADEHRSPYYRPGSSKDYPKPPPSGGHSLSSLYEPLSFDDLYNSPKSHYSSPSTKSVFSGGKPTHFGSSPPSHVLSHTYGSSMEYHPGMPPKPHGHGGMYSTSSSPYGSNLHGVPKYKAIFDHERASSQNPHHHNPYRYPKPAINVEKITLTKTEDEPIFKKSESSPSPVKKAEIDPKVYLKDRTQIQVLSAFRRIVQQQPNQKEGHKVVVNKTPQFSKTYHQQNEAQPSFLPPPQYSRPIPSGPSSQNLRGDRSSDEVVDIHIYEKGFFDKSKKPWIPVSRFYKNLAASVEEGGHGSASMERAAAAAAAVELERNKNKFHDRPPPPSRRSESVNEFRNAKPYHRSNEEEENNSSQIRHIPYIKFDARRI